MNSKFVTVKGFKKFVSENKDVSNTIITKDYEIISNEQGSTFVITTDSPDRDSDVISPSGIDITNYLKNPVVLWGHDSTQLPIGKCVNIEQVGNGLQATVEFVPSDYPYIGDKAEAIRRSIKDGFLNAVSIGFIPTEWDFNESGGLNITKSELTEFSIVSIPANPEALVIERDLSSTDQPLIPEEQPEEPEGSPSLSDEEKSLKRERIKAVYTKFGI